MSSNRQAPARKLAKKAYQRPRLKVHGHIQALTRTVGPFSATGDGGIGGQSKTH
jgi:hypothetical protein